jgi:hypothetical protein
VPQVRHLLSVTLPARRRDAGAMLAFLQEVQRRNYAAARAHRQRRLRLLHQRLDTS